MRRFAVIAVLLASAAHAHDVTAEVSGSLVKASENNPRSGSLGVSLSGAYDFDERWSAWLGVTYLRDLGTRTETSSSTGSNVFLLHGGALFVPTEHWSVMASLNGSPPAHQDNASVRTFVRLDGTQGTADVVVVSDTFSLGGVVVGGWASAGDSKWEHLVDASVGVTYLSTRQALGTGSTVFPLLRFLCTRNPAGPNCPLVAGVRSALAQVRLGAVYTANLFSRFDLSLDVGGYLYSEDPLSVGVFSIVANGREGADLSNGVPVAPFAVTLRPSGVYRFERVTLRLAYQAGVYVSGLGTNHLVSLRAAFKLSRAVRLNATVTGQVDAAPGERLQNWGGTVVLGTLIVF